MADPIRRTLADLRAAGAPSFFERDPTVLKSQMAAEFERVSGRTLYPAQTEMFLIEVAAYALSILHEAAQLASEQNTAVFAEGAHLEHLGANVSTPRLLAQPAKTTLQFSLSAVRLVDVGIPKGTRVAAGDKIVFATDRDLVIPSGMTAASVTATAEAAGGAFNGLAIGAVTDILDPIAYVAEARNTAIVAGGTDVEDIERYRLRVVNALYTIAKTGPRAGYREHVLSVDPEIIDVAVIRPEPGRVHIYPLMRTGAPTAELRAAVLAYLDPETRRPMGDDVAVLAPLAVPFTFSLTVRTAQALSDIAAQADAAARSAFAEWSSALGRQVSPAAVVAAVKALAGVTDVAITGLAFTALSPSQYAVLSGLTVAVEVVSNG